MMKKLSLAICYILINVIAFAQSRYSGKVLDAATSLPITGATIQVDQTATYLSDENGNFSIPLSSSQRIITITSIGYKTQQLSVAEKLPEIRLDRYNLFLQPVEIRATRASDKSPFTKTNIGKTEIERNNLGQDLPFLLNQTPSVVVNSDAGNGFGYTGIRIRGTDATRINMTLNGIPYNDAESQGIFFVNLPDFLSSVNSIQIQRGVGTSSNGAGAFGATLNLSTNEFNEKPYAELNNTAGTYNTWKHTLKVGSGLISDHFTIDARLSKISSDGYIDRGSSDLRSFYLSGAYLTPTSSLRLNVFSGKEKTYQAWNGIPEAKLRNNQEALLQHYYNNVGSLYFTEADSTNLFTADPRKYNVFLYPNQTDNYQQDHYQLFFNHAFNEQLSMNTAVFLTQGKGYYEEFKYQARYSSYGLPDFQLGSETLTKTDLIRQLWLDNNLYGGIFSVQYKNKTNEAVIGGGINQYDGKHKGYVTWATAGVPDNYNWYHHTAGKTDYNLYGKWQMKITEHLLSLVDLQYRRVDYHINGSRKFPELVVNETFHFFNPKFGLSYSKGPLTAYASYAIANKEPNRNDYETGTVQGKPLPERLKDLEAGLEVKQAQFSWNTTLYYMNYKDQLVLVGKVNDVGDPVRVNVPQSYRLGAELQAMYKPSRLLAVSGNLALSQNRINQFTDNIPRYDASFNLLQQDTMYYHHTPMALSPSMVAGATIQVFPVRNLDLSLLNKYVGEQFLDNTGNENRKLNPFFTQDLRAGYTIQKWLAREINFIVQINNVWNKRYESNGYTYSYIYDNSTVTENFYYPMAGRNVLVALNIKF
nr:Cna protein B-type domain protein [uncultured bacterium]